MLRFCFFLFIFICGFGAQAQASETTMPGASCLNGLHRADWDTIFQCVGGVWKKAAYWFGASSDTCDAGHAGIVQWTGTSLQVCSGASWQTLASAVGASSTTPGANCASLLALGAKADGVYWIKPDSGAAFQVYCDMSHDGGGWALIMRIAASSVLTYASSYWTDQNTLNPTDLTPDANTDAKYPSFYRLTGSTLRGCNAGKGLCTMLNIPTQTAQNLFSSAGMTGGYLSRTTMITLYPPDDSTEPNCNQSGINVYQGGTGGYYAWARFGFVANNEADCNTTDAAWGWGIGDTALSLQCGAGTVGYFGGAGAKYCAQGTLWIR